MAKIPDPTLKLDERYGIDTDTHNWMLFYRGNARSGHGLGAWRIVGYYPSLRALLLHFSERCMREGVESDLLTTLNTVEKAVADAIEAISSQVDTLLEVLEKTRLNRLSDKV